MKGKVERNEIKNHKGWSNTMSYRSVIQKKKKYSHKHIHTLDNLKNLYIFVFFPFIIIVVLILLPLPSFVSLFHSPRLISFFLIFSQRCTGKTNERSWNILYIFFSFSFPSLFVLIHLMTFLIFLLFANHLSMCCATVILCIYTSLCILFWGNPPS
jgi:hypothetical protein